MKLAKKSAFVLVAMLLFAACGFAQVQVNGSVSVYLNTNVLQCTATVTNGAYSCPTSTIPLGTYPLDAVFTPSDNNTQASTSQPFNETIGAAPTTTTITATPNPGSVGGTVTVSGTVTPQ
jgi:hypothetical protein